MSDTTDDAVRARDEAAAWFTRFNQLSVSSDALREWRDWRQNPVNVAAYAKVEATWEAAKGLKANPRISAETAGLLKRYPAQPQRAAGITRQLPWAIATASVVALVAGTAMWLGIPAPSDYSTRVGEQRLVVLNDGSRVRLNTNSQIQVRFGPDVRRVTLVRGEAFFEAAHNAQRPFIVEADGAQVRAIGTKFDVRRDANAVQVILLAGKVGVTERSGGASTVLVPNQRLTVSALGVSPVRTTDAVEQAGWTSGRLTFRSVPLQDAIAEVNRYAPRPIVLADAPQIAQQPLSGVFDTTDTPAFVSAVASIYDLQAVTTPEGTTRLSPRAKPSEN